MRLRQLSTLLLVLATAPGWTAETTDYRFTPNDVIEITVTPQSNFDRTVTVQPDGKISYPIVGQIQVAGLTVAQLAAKLHEGLNRQLVDPQVVVSLKAISPQAAARVSLLGAVFRPGVYEIKPGTTVAEALALGGGPMPHADLRRVTITHADQSVVTADLAQTDRTGRLERNVALQPGDLIVVPEGARTTILVLGEVAKPGSYELQKEARLLDAISLAGGPTPRADLRHVTLARSAGTSGTQTLDLDSLLSGGASADPACNLPLQPGDTILVGETDQRIYVLGAVARPDSYSIRPNDRILDALVKAGGASPNADLPKAVLVRRGATGQPEPKPLDLKKIMATGDTAANALVRPGDVLYVPDKKIRTGRSILDTALGLLPLASLIRLFGTSHGGASSLW
jgi:polysaccharide export outer membrane protein